MPAADRPACVTLESITRIRIMADTVSDTVESGDVAGRRHGAASARRSGLQRFMRRRSTIALLMCTAADPHHRRADHLSGVLFDLSVDAEQGADPLHRPVGNFTFLMSRDTFWMVVRQSAIFALSRRVLQGADRPDHRASRQQPAGQRPAQMARHAAGAVGDPAGAVDARLVVDVRSHQFGIQLYAQKPGLRWNSRG